MEVLELFPTVVGVFDCDTFDRHASMWRAEVATAFKERGEKFASPQHQTDDRLHERPQLAGLIAFFRRSSAEYMRGLKYKNGVELRLQGCWASTLVGPDRFEIHQHPNSFLSGAFYLDVGEGAKPLLFRDPRSQSRNFDIPVEEELLINTKYHAIAAINGRLLLFPSWLEHRVPPSFSEVPRVSLSFNMTVHGDVGSTQESTRATI
jgi:uncharacterized protein (TIGR02466 family)